VYDAKRIHELLLNQVQTLRMKGVWEAPSPKQEQIIALTAAVSSLKYKARSGKSKTTSKENTKQADTGPSRNNGNFAWKDVAPKAGEATTKLMNRRPITGARITPIQCWYYTTQQPFRISVDSTPSKRRWKPPTKPRREELPGARTPRQQTSNSAKQW
jgi:hypothetical protein